MNALRFGQPVIVSPQDGAPYAARYAQSGPSPTLVYVRGPQGLHPVPAATVTPRTLGLGDDKAARHGVGRASGGAIVSLAHISRIDGARP